MQFILDQLAKLSVAFPHLITVLVLLCQRRVGARPEDASGGCQRRDGSCGEPGWEKVRQEISWREVTARNRIQIMREILRRAEQWGQSFSQPSGCALTSSGKGKLLSPGRRDWCCFSEAFCASVPLEYWSAIAVLQDGILLSNRAETWTVMAVFCHMASWTGLWKQGPEDPLQFNGWGGRFVSLSGGVRVCVVRFMASHLH